MIVCMIKKYLISLIECVYAFWGNIYINVPTVEILVFLLLYVYKWTTPKRFD